MIVLAFTPEEAARITAGEQTVVTYPADLRLTEQLLTPLVVGQTVAIARLPGLIESTTKNVSTSHRGFTEGAIVGSARVADAVRVKTGCLTHLWVDGHICVTGNTVLYYPHHSSERFTVDVTGMADFTPGRWALILTDAAPCEQRCPACGGRGLVNENSEPQWCRCERDHTTSRIGTCAPIPCEVTGPIMEVTL